MKPFALVFSVSLAVAFAAPADKLADLSKKQFAGDWKLKTTQVKQGVCGGDGPSMIVEVQVKNLVKVINNRTQRIDLKEKWTTVKTYGIPRAELSKPNPRLIDQEACLE